MLLGKSIYKRIDVRDLYTFAARKLICSLVDAVLKREPLFDVGNELLSDIVLDRGRKLIEVLNCVL